MGILFLKLIRDLWRSKGQYFAVGVMISLGVMFFAAATMAYRNLSISYEETYRRLVFEDASIRVAAAPSRIQKRLERIPGLAAVEARLTEDVAIELPGRGSKKLVGRMISVPSGREPRVNRLFVKEGSYLSRQGAREILLESSFAKYHKLHPGDMVYAKWGPDKVRLTVVGIVQSPEFLYVVQSKQDLFPMPDSFGVMFVSDDVLGSLLSKRDIVNDIKLRFSEGASPDVVLREVKQSLASYRPEEPVMRIDQPSHQLLQQDIDGFKVYSFLFPFMFLSVAALTVYALLTRLVQLQRPHIGLMRALGFSRLAIIQHYLMLSAVVGILSGTVGTALGLWMSGGITRMYTGFLSVPYVLVVPDWGVVLQGVAVGIAVCMVAAIAPAIAASGINPAETLRGSPPATPKVARIDLIVSFLALRWRIPIRNIVRQPKRTLSTLFGVISSALLFLTARGMLDSMDSVVSAMVGEAFREDMRVDFTTFRTATEVDRVRQWPGVAWAEGSLDVPTEFRSGDVTYSALLSGLPEGSQLRKISDGKGGQLALPADGIVVGGTIQNRLHLELGDFVDVRLPRGATEEEPRWRTVRVVGFSKEAIGTVAYATMPQVRKLFGSDLGLPPSAISGIRVKAERDLWPDVRERLLSLPNAAAVTARSQLEKKVEELMATSKRFVLIMEAFGIMLAFAILFNTVTVNVLERVQEVATMRTIGVSSLQVSVMVVFENLLLTMLGLLIAFPLAKPFVQSFITAGQTEEQMELFTMQASLKPESLLVAALAILVVTLVSQIPSLMFLSKLDLARATKERAT